MRNDTDTRFSSCQTVPAGGRRQLLLANLQLDGGLLKTPTCPTAVVRHSAASVAGSTPKTKQLADSDSGQ